MNLRYLSMSQLAEVAGIDRRTVKDRLTEVKPHTKEGKAIIFDARIALPVLFGHVSDDKSVLKEINRQNLRFETARADKLEMELEETKGQLVPSEDVCKAVEKEYTYVRSTLLSIPSKRAKALALETDPSQIRAMLEEDVNEALSHLQADIHYAKKEETSKVLETEDKSEEI